MRVSNGIAVVLLFVTGWAFGRLVEYRPWLTGIAMVVLGGLSWPSRWPWEDKVMRRITTS